MDAGRDARGELRDEKDSEAERRQQRERDKLGGGERRGWREGTTVRGTAFTWRDACGDGVKVYAWRWD